MLDCGFLQHNLMHSNKTIGAILLLAGTAIGAGMLALPLVSATSGFLSAALLTIFLWAVMTITALLILEVNLAFKPFHNSFGTMALETLGKPGEIIAWITILLLLYSLTAAYIAGNGSLLTSLINHIFHIRLAHWIPTLLFTLILGSAVYWSTETVDWLNRVFISIKGVFLILALTLLMPHVDITKLVHTHGPFRYLIAAAPIMLTSFGFHTVIPSLTNYIGVEPKKLKKVIIIGASVPLILYLLWLIATLGIIPLIGKNSFQAIQHSHSAVGSLLIALSNIVENHYVNFAVNTFSDIAMTTSFLGVSLGLFDFLADGFRRSNSRFGRLQTALITFIPPILFAMFYPKGFIIALGYAAIFVAILEIIIPAMMAHKIRRSKTRQSPYRVFGGKILLIAITFIGVVLIVIQLLSIIHILPFYSG